MKWLGFDFLMGELPKLAIIIYFRIINIINSKSFKRYLKYSYFNKFMFAQNKETVKDDMQKIFDEVQTIKI